MLGKTLKDEIDLDWDEKEENEYTCDVCGRGLDEEDINSSPDGDGTYCNDCYRERWAYCESCGEDRSREDGSTISHQFYCEECRDEIFTRCNDCDRWTRRDEIVFVTALSPNGFTETREVGENCLAHYTECSHCHNFFSPSLLENGVCKECQPALPLMELAQMENV
jgi:hypothetical protein